ncbi:fatty acid--CoA ligase family protein [Paenibacillus sp. sptzw28]|uniref:ANL family adenylate-forming protein n=1 Tax=Paenibacillus sp. sptzw28 TaxID=715179 RepID=UPI001C6F2227|nr:fatty acid--CoA ligase family protein [Paenibacillus sp. sptzw28]QYR19387.1 fatty acid--CoA ligase family protein [Paenibacillus sp. sptzw28]
MVIDWLLGKMSGFAYRQAMVIAGNSVSYGDLLGFYRSWTGIIGDQRIKPGEVILLEGDYSPEVCGALLAFIANNNVIVPLSAAVRHNREGLMEIAQVDKSVHFEGRNSQVVTNSRAPKTGLLKDFTLSGRAGMILFTSGSTGAPKAILHDFEPFIDRYKYPRDTLRTLSFLLFDHIGGINTLLHTLSNGGSIICPPNRSPADICALIEKHQVELLPASPSFLNMLLMTEAYKYYDMSSLKIITYGTEVMPDITLRLLHSRFPDVQLRQTYGLSELGILRAKSKGPGSPWLKIGGEGVDTKVVDGVLHIRSKSAMLGYLNAPNPFDDEGWFNTEDQVSEEGEYIRIFGRRSEIINVGGRKVYPVEVEQVLLQMPELRDVTVKGEPNTILGSIVTAVVNVNRPMDSKELKSRVKDFCRGRLEDFQIPVKVYIEEGELFSERYKKLRK